MIDVLLPGPGGAIAVVVAVGVDAAFGEPPARWHPVVWTGRALSSTGAPWRSASPPIAFIRGMGVWVAGAVAWLGIAALVSIAFAYVVRHQAPFSRVCVRGVLLGVALKPLLAWKLLRDEVGAVEQALSESLAAGRERLKFLVSRKVDALTATEVRESALESLAENLNDSFVAPLFWFAVGGLPAAALYRFANTADAMWGYRDRWEWAGKWSARADDVLSYVPARLTALLIVVVARNWPRTLRREAARTPSPNGGWPMAMMALALDVRLSKPGAYILHAAGRSASAADLQRGLRVAAHAAWLAVVLAVVMLLGSWHILAPPCTGVG